MNNLEISSNQSLLGVDLPQSLNISPSMSTFMAEEDASTCPLLTPSPPPFNDPLTPNIHAENGAQQRNDEKFVNNDSRAAEDETSSCSGSSGIGIDGQVVAGTTTVFNPNVYQHLGRNGEAMPQSETKLHAHLNLPDSKDVPFFVYWNWTLIRRCSFVIFVAGVVAMIGIVIAMIYSLPRTCNPKTVWYEGSVFYEIHPSRFPDSNADRVGDIRGLQHRVDYFTKLGVVGVRLNSIFPSKSLPEHVTNVTNIYAIDEVLGSVEDLKDLARIFHKNNLSLILDLPIYPFITQLESVDSLNEGTTKQPLQGDEGQLRIARSSNEENRVVKALMLWMKCGIDGFYVNGIENLHHDPLLLDNIRTWKSILGPNRTLMINNQLLENVDPSLTEKILKHVDLVDFIIDVTKGTKGIAEQISKSLRGLLKPENGAYIQWSIGGVSEHQSYELTSNGTLAATLMSLMLPGSPNIYHGDELSHRSHQHFSESIDSEHMHHLPALAWHTTPQITEQQVSKSNRTVQLNQEDFDEIAKMISLRNQSPSIYKNVIKKRGKMESNTSAKYFVNGNILIVMRWYPRRNTFASISNFGTEAVIIDLSNHFYSGEVMVGGKGYEKIYFNQFEIGPIQTLIVKLDK